MKLDFNTASSTLVVRKAFLMYEEVDRDNGVSNGLSYVSVHNVRNIGTEKKQNFQIMAGQPAALDDLKGLAKELSSKFMVNTEILDSRVLSMSPYHLAWYCAATNRNVFFNCRELGKRSAVVPHPGLVFIVSGASWFVFAVKGDQRPSKDTPTFHAPYFNVWKKGNICVGSAKIPDKLSPNTIPIWEDAFFQSEFTHANDMDQRRTSHQRGDYAFWKEQLDGKFQAFPEELLVPINLSLGELVTKLVQNGKGQ